MISEMTDTFRNTTSAVNQKFARTSLIETSTCLGVIRKNLIRQSGVLRLSHFPLQYLKFYSENAKMIRNMPQCFIEKQAPGVVRLKKILRLIFSSKSFGFIMKNFATVIFNGYQR